MTVERFAKAIHEHTAASGVWVDLDLCGPANLDRAVVLHLEDNDGEQTGAIRDLSTRARFFRFATDFRANAGVPFDYEEREDGGIELRGALAGHPSAPRGSPSGLSRALG